MQYGQRFGFSASVYPQPLPRTYETFTLRIQRWIKSNSDLIPKVTSNTSMNAARGPGEYQPRTPHPINGADIPTGYASRLWTRLTPVKIRDRVNEISKRFTGAGWKNLPQELVDEIIGYLQDDPDALKACSLTCKYLFGATRPLIHRRLVCLGSRPEYTKPKPSLLGTFNRRKRDPGVFERLIDADRSGVLPYTKYLILKPKHADNSPRFDPRDVQEYLPHLRSIAKLHSLTLDTFCLPPVFSECFGMFTNTLRHLDIRNASCSEQELLYIICQFPLLEDLSIISPVIGLSLHPAPAITQSPLLRGKLVLVKPASKELSEGLAALPGGLNFRSLELSRCKHLEAVLAACSHTATSVSYLWQSGDIDGKSKPSIHPYIWM